MITKVLVVLFLCLGIVFGAAYFILWPMVQRGMVAVTSVLQTTVENVQETLPTVIPENVPSIGELIAVLPILGRIGVERLVQIQEIAAGGVSREEAQQILDILGNQLSSEELARFKELLNLPQS